MMPKFESIFGTVQSYNFFITLGTVIGVILFTILCYLRFKNLKISIISSVSIAIFMMLGSYFSRLVRFLTRWDGENFIEEFNQYKGVHFVGAVLFVAIVFPMFCRILMKNKQDANKLVNLMAFYLVIQHLFNRIACLMTGCCYGKAYYGIFALKFNQGDAYDFGVRHTVFPTQAFEIICMLVLLAILIWGNKTNKHIFSIFCIGFGITIFISEFFMDGLGTVLILGMSWIQIFAIIVIVIGIVRKLLNE